MLGFLRCNKAGGSGMMAVFKGQPRQVLSYATDVDRMSPVYKAPPILVAQHQDRVDNLDPELRALTILCNAVKLEDRPDIEYLLKEVERNVRTKTPDYYRMYKFSALESDVAIKRIVQSYMYDA
jgi:hypothetical protein